jgi:dolichol-phosphate mannosyltransferase
VIFVIFPAHDEEQAIGAALRALAAAARGAATPYHVVLVDDGSTDRTVAEAQAAAAEDAGGLPLTILRHEASRGLGGALRTGIYWCLDRAGDDDVVVTLDADNTHPPAIIPALVARLDERHDLAIASRYRPGAVVRGVPAHRRALSDAGRLAFRVLFPIPGVRDYTCCFRAYRVRLLRTARLAWGEGFCSARGFEAVADLLLQLRPLGVRAAELGFELDYRARAGHSQMRVLHTVRTTLAMLARRSLERFTVASPARLRARIAAAGPTPATGPPETDPSAGRP